MEEIIKTYENHPSIKLIKDNVLSENKDFTIEPATVLEINKIIKNLNPKKATVPGKIPVKIVKKFKKDDRANIKNYKHLAF